MFRLTLLLLLPLFYSAQNPFVGKWICYKQEALSKKQIVIVDASQGNIEKAEFVFNADSTFVQTIFGIKRMGRYLSKENWLIFFLVNNKGVWEKSFSMRWPIGEKDPVPRTPEFDFIHPEVLPVINRKGKQMMGDVDLYYKKQSN